MKLSSMILGVFIVLSISPVVLGSPIPCPNTNAIVDAVDVEDFAMACEVVADTAQFMQSHGFDVSDQLNVAVVDEITTLHPYPVFGQYDSHLKAIEILSYAACTKLSGERQIFGQRITEELHRSFIAHEVAHAYAHRSFRFNTPSVVAHEYIAYSVQLATMAAELRKTILKSINVGAFENKKEIGETYLSLNPDYFAVKSYLHMMKAENGKWFYQRLLNGEFRPNGNGAQRY